MRNIIFIYSFVFAIYLISANLNTITTTMILSPTVSLNCDPSTQIQFFNNTCCLQNGSPGIIENIEFIIH